MCFCCKIPKRQSLDEDREISYKHSLAPFEGSQGGLLRESLWGFGIPLSAGEVCLGKNRFFYAKQVSLVISFGLLKK